MYIQDAPKIHICIIYMTTYFYDIYIVYVPAALCRHRYEYSSKAFECYHCQKHSKIPNLNFESNIENIFTIPQQGEPNSFG